MGADVEDDEPEIKKYTLAWINRDIIAWKQQGNNEGCDRH